MNMSGIALQIILLLVLIFLSAFFSMSETALTSMSPVKVGNLVEQKKRGAKTLSGLIETPGKFLGTILVGNNLVNISASALATSVSIQVLEIYGLHELGIAVGIAIGITAFFILVFGEITPKTIAIHNAEAISLFSAPIIRFFEIILSPFVKIFAFVSVPFIRIFGGRMPAKGPFLTLDEIKMLILAGEREGLIEEEEKEMISSIFEFGETIVREVMTPRPDIQCLPVESSVDKAIKTILEGGHSRIPLYEGNMDNIVGIIYAKDLLKAVEMEKEKLSLKDFMRPAIFIPESKKVDDLLHQMQAARTHIAIIVDEYGIASGLVTLEDLVEEIVGEIYDEFEKKVKSIEKIDERTYVVDARLSIPDINSALKIRLPKKKYDTIGGFVMDQLGKVPAVGDTVKYGSLQISVERVIRRRITRVKIERTPRKQQEGLEAVGG